MIGIEQGWPHFLCGGIKVPPKKLAGTKICSKKAWRAKLGLEKHTIEPIKA